MEASPLDLRLPLSTLCALNLNRGVLHDLWRCSTVSISVVWGGRLRAPWQYMWTAKAAASCKPVALLRPVHAMAHGFVGLMSSLSGAGTHRSIGDTECETACTAPS